MKIGRVPYSSARPQQIADLDGPRRWPFLGNLPQLELSRMHQQLEEWTGVYGQRYRIRIGRRDALVVARPDLIADILRERPDKWRRFRVTEAVLHDMGINGVFSAEGEIWRRQRRLVAGAFTPGQLKRYFPSVSRVTDCLRAQLDGAARDGAWVDLQGLLMRYTVDVTASLAFGVDVNTLEQPKTALQEHLDKVLPMVMQRQNAPFPLWRYLKLPGDRAFDRHLAHGHAAVKSFIAAARGRMADNPALVDSPTNLLEAMLAARDADGNALSDEEVIGNTFTLLLAGEDTTANTLAWRLYFLHNDRSTWRMVVAEVDNALGSDAIPRSIQALATLSVVDNCLQESMRLKPVAPLHYFENNTPVVIDGIALPAGTLVLGVMRSGAVDTQVVSDADIFRPARWQDAPDGTQSGTSRNGDLIAASMPFGAGPRMCPGRYLAMLEMEMVLATIAHNYELIEVGTEDGVPPRERMAFAMSPVGLRMKLRKRIDEPGTGLRQ